MTALLVLPDCSASLTGKIEAQMCNTLAKRRFCLHFQRQWVAETAFPVSHDLSTNWTCRAADASSFDITTAMAGFIGKQCQDNTLRDLKRLCTDYCHLARFSTCSLTRSQQLIRYCLYPGQAHGQGSDTHAGVEEVGAHTCLLSIVEFVYTCEDLSSFLRLTISIRGPRISSIRLRKGSHTHVVDNVRCRFQNESLDILQVFASNYPPAWLLLTLSAA